MLRRIPPSAFATDPSLVVKYSGQTVNMCYEYPSLLREIQDEVENLLGVRFNHCMLNYYDDGSVYIGKHRDNKENKLRTCCNDPQRFLGTVTNLNLAFARVESSLLCLWAPRGRS